MNRFDDYSAYSICKGAAPVMTSNISPIEFEGAHYAHG